MIGKPVVLIQVPAQRLFSPRAAARYLGIHPNTLKKYADLGIIVARRMGKGRVFCLEELDRFIEALPEYTALGKNPGLSLNDKGIADGNL